VRALECLKAHFDGKLPADEWAELKKKVDMMKRIDGRNLNKGGLVDIDEFAEGMLDQYSRLDKIAATKISDLFQATDFNNNAFISADEFTVAYRNVVPGNLGKDYAYMLFQDYMEELYD